MSYYEAKKSREISNLGKTDNIPSYMKRHTLSNLILNTLQRNREKANVLQTHFGFNHM